MGVPKKKEKKHKRIVDGSRGRVHIVFTEARDAAEKETENMNLKINNQDTIMNINAALKFAYIQLQGCGYIVGGVDCGSKWIGSRVDAVDFAIALETLLSKHCKVEL